jgi:hypothetical protein
MVKRSIQADSGRKMGLELHHRSSDCSRKWSQWGIQNFRKSGPTLMITQQPEAGRPNGVDRQIQRVKLV